MDERTQQTLDDLADLFLTGTAEPPTSPKAPPPKLATPNASILTKPAPPPVEAPPQSFRPTSRPESQRPAEPLTRSDPPTAPTSTHDAPATRPSQPTPDPNHEARGRSQAPESPRAPQAPAAPRVEAVLLGNLPGMAHVWLTQYAQLLAEQDGPVLLLTLDPETKTPQGQGQIEAELIQPKLTDSLEQQPAPTNPAQTTDARFPSARPTDDDAEQHALDQLLGFDAQRTAVAERRSAPAAHHAAETPELPRNIADLLQTHLSAKNPVGTVLIYTDTDPRQIDPLLDIGVWTLLTGADPTAVHAAAAALHQLADADPQAHEAQVGLFVVGSPQPKADTAAKQIITQTADRFEHAPIHLGFLQRMRPAAVKTLGNFPHLDDQWNHLLQALDQVEASHAAPQPVPTTPEPKLKPTLEPAATPPSRNAAALNEPQLDRGLLANFLNDARQRTITPKARTTTPTTPTPPTPQRVANAPKRETASTPTTPTEPTKPTVPTKSAKPEPSGTPATAIKVSQPSSQPTPQPTPFPDLLQLLTQADPRLTLRPLPARSPEHPDIALALDAQGRLHLLARLHDAEHPRAALLELTDAKRWATRHRELLALTLPQNQPPSAVHATPPALHLFTHQPERAVPLATAIDPAIRLHLLQHLHLQAGPTWLATPLQPADA